MAEGRDTPLSPDDNSIVADGEDQTIQIGSGNQHINYVYPRTSGQAENIAVPKVDELSPKQDPVREQDDSKCFKSKTLRFSGKGGVLQIGSGNVAANIKPEENSSQVPAPSTCQSRVEHGTQGTLPYPKQETGLDTKGLHKVVTSQKEVFETSDQANEKPEDCYDRVEQPDDSMFDLQACRSLQATKGSKTGGGEPKQRCRKASVRRTSPPDNNVIWQWQDDKGNWQTYPDAEMAKLIKEYQAGERTCIVRNNARVIFDQPMYERCCSQPIVKRPVRRIESASSGQSDAQ